ncbi:3-methyladenine DNA glycosylase [Oceanicola sp. 22II-s10i]|uniref:c-type cytochrome n=1 Tax=Oceanicola sp. 22II-s10i TaxID=1317116 RepID=UPI000B52397D|nr:cytochrome c [Oceanicola sp. 22II-s10i]OWU84236.1 3-methyladenine DNA glycosylase [Oceanicola sp. 22II-s10i]
MSITGIRSAPAAVALTLAMATPALAAEPIGEREFMHSCAICHGTDAKGSGQFAELMTVQVPDLTGIAKANDGVFPLLSVVHIVDGRSGVRGHGSPMPIWGDRFKAEIGDSKGDYGAEIEVRGRILSLVYYLESVQQ